MTAEQLRVAEAGFHAAARRFAVSCEQMAAQSGQVAASVNRFSVQLAAARAHLLEQGQRIERVDE